VSIARDPKQ